MPVWNPLSIEEIKKLINQSPVKCWLAGGYALDRFLGRATRKHGDIDIIVLRKNQLLFQKYLKHWTLYKADGDLSLWNKGEYIHKPVQDIWVSDESNGSFKFQIMLIDSINNRWVFKYDASISVNLSDFGYIKDDLPIIQPEIQLLYKLWKPEYRKKDMLDLNNCLPFLNQNKLKWLAKNLGRANHNSVALGKINEYIS